MAEKPNEGTRNPRTRDNKGRGQSARVDPQTGSLLFRRLPQEIRDRIWTQLFCSTRFAFGKRPINLDLTVRVKPAPNGLALLRACRRARLEIGDAWLRHVLFCFEDAGTMLDKLSPLPVDAISKIRHLRISHTWITLRFPDDYEPDDDLGHGPGDCKLYHLAAVLKLLPGLQLDQLTVLGSAGGRDNHETLLHLVKDGSGWKTLRFICYNPTGLWLPLDDDHGWTMLFTRELQTSIEGRDGVASTPSVAVYHVRDTALSGSILDAGNRSRYGQQSPDGQELRPEVLPGSPDSEPKRELMVVVKRGDGVDYQEKKGSPLIECDLRRELDGTDAWTKIRALCFDGSDDESEAEDEADVYEDVDQYDWTPAQIYPDGTYP